MHQRIRASICKTLENTPPKRRVYSAHANIRDSTSSRRDTTLYSNRETHILPRAPPMEHHSQRVDLSLAVVWWPWCRPGVCLARVPNNGRNFEYISGEDPHLGAMMANAAVRGIQSQNVCFKKSFGVLYSTRVGRVSLLQGSCATTAGGW